MSRYQFDMRSLPNVYGVMPVRPAPFEEIKAYQMPQHLVGMAIDGELSLPGVRKLLFSPEHLSTKERENHVQRMKVAAGGGALTNTLIDLATNPFVWFMFVTSAVGGTALSRAGQGIFSGARKYSPFLEKQAGWLQAIAALTPMQMFNNTAITPALMQITRDIDKMDKQMARHVVGPLKKVLQKHNLNTLDPTLVVGEREKLVATRINDAIGAKLAGMDRTWVERQPRVTGQASRGTLAVEVAQTTIQKKVTADLDKVLQGLGATELYRGMKKAMSERYVRLFGKDEYYKRTGQFQLNEDKVKRIYRGLRYKVTRGASALDAGTGAGVVGRLFGPDMARAIELNLVSGEDFYKMLRTVAGSPNPHYLPRNLLEMRGGGMDAATLAAQRESTSFMATGATTPRRVAPALHDPDDLKRIADQFGATPAMRSMIREHRRVIDAADAGGDAVHTFRLNMFKSAQRYFKNTGETHALYVERAIDSPGVMVARKEWNGLIGKDKLDEIRRAQAEFKKTFSDGRDRWGGLSIADVLFEQHAGMVNQHSRRALTDVVLPRLLGREDYRALPHLGSLAALLSGKQALAGLLETGVGTALRGSGGQGQKMYDRLRVLADPDVPMAAGRTASASLARYLYVTHLGLNLSSVVLNLTQPFLLAGTWLGARNVLKGYRQGFKELGAYMGERSRMNFRRLTDAEQGVLLRKHFKHTDVDGVNLLGIGRTPFESIDAVTFRTAGSLDRIAKKESFLFDVPLKPFEKAEWLNRSVTAHAVEAAYKEAGRFPALANREATAAMNADIFRMVGETQFGGTVLNTPLAMLGGGALGRVFDNPLMRQFLSFPIRSFTGVVFQGPRIGGGTRTVFGKAIGEGYWRNLGFDVMRGMGISSVVYELGKNFLGADVSRGLFAQASLDIIGGERFLEDSNEFIPIPPVVDIPIDLIRGFATGDVEVFQQTIPRMFPGGIAFARALGMAPRLPDTWLAGLPHSLQKTYVGWDFRDEKGFVPVFKGDGTLIDFRHGGELILRSLGADLGRFANAGELDNYLVRNREEMVRMKAEAIRQYLANNIDKGESIRRQFAKRFGMPLKITKQQWQSAIRLRTTPRPERMLDRMPRDARHLYAELLKVSQPSRLGIPAEALTASETSRGRDVLRKNETLALDPETVKHIQAMVAAQVEQDKAGKSFRGYGGFQ